MGKVSDFLQLVAKPGAINSRNLRVKAERKSEALAKFLSGTQILEEVISPVNGKVQVVRSLGLGTYIQAEGLTQSGGIMESVWGKPLKKTKNQKPKIKNILILGLGGGTAAKLVRKYWPYTKITGVDLDPIMVNLGKKYLGLDKLDVKVVIDDAYNFLKNSKFHIPNSIFDLILVDLYVGDKFPEKFESENYIQLIRSVLASDGVAVFNRLYWGEKRPKAMRFLKKLEKNFKNVDVVYPEANIMFICSK